MNRLKKCSVYHVLLLCINFLFIYCGITERSQTISAGFGKANITPLTSIVYMGFKKMAGVHDSLYVRAAAFQDGSKRMIILSADVVTIERAVMDRARDAVQKLVNIPKENIVITSTHTHAVPYGSHNIIGMEEFKPLENVFKDWKKWWFENFVNGCADAARQCLDDMAPVKTGSAVFDIAQIASNRRINMPSGEIVNRSVQKN